MPKTEETKNDTFRRELSSIINKNGIDNDFDTPDYILTDYIISILLSYNMLKRQMKKHALTNNEDTLKLNR